MSESTITKKAISQGLKNLVRKKSFDKITIADIANECGLNRQTFYYHFQDKYELLNWIYYNEAISILTKDLTFESWNDKFLEMLCTMKKDAYFYQHTLRASSQGDFQDYLFCFSREFFSDIIERLSQEKEMSKGDREFFSEFFSYGIVGIIVSWAKKGMKEEPEAIAKHLKNLVYDSKKFAVLKFFQEQKE